MPKDWVHKLIRKSEASLALRGKLTGSIDTKEKFEIKRMKLASNEWARMKESNSGECRNCHDFDAMSSELQKQTPYIKHMKAKKDGKTCADCHKGIAHQLPNAARERKPFAHVVGVFLWRYSSYAYIHRLSYRRDYVHDIDRALSMTGSSNFYEVEK